MSYDEVDSYKRQGNLTARERMDSGFEDKESLRKEDLGDKAVFKSPEIPKPSGSYITSNRRSLDQDHYRQHSGKDSGPSVRRQEGKTDNTEQQEPKEQVNKVHGLLDDSMYDAVSEIGDWDDTERRDDWLWQHKGDNSRQRDLMKPVTVKTLPSGNRDYCVFFNFLRNMSHRNWKIKVLKHFIYNDLC